MGRRGGSGSKTMTALALAISLSMSLGAVTASPAAADHSNVYSHWGHGYRPWVNVPDSSLWHFTSEAEWGWSVNGYPNGFCVGGCAPPQNLCDRLFHPGGIVVCGVNDGDSLLPAGYIGWTYDNWVFNPNRHIESSYIVICMNCGGTQTDFDRHKVVNHEYGHALGSGHTADPNCLMFANTATKFQCRHDADAMWAAYAPHIEGG